MSRPKLALVIGAAVVATAACSSGTGSNDHSTAPHPASRVQTSASTAGPSPSTAPKPRSSAAAGALSGTWHGHYSGGYSGTFVLTWQQSGASLSGTITLSDPAATVPIHGSVSGTGINFGTVGSYAITYTGSESANSMSGNYQVAGAAAGGGTWSATKP